MRANSIKGRILVVDDDERGRSLLAGCLRAHGYDVEEVCTATECLGRAAEADCDLVLIEKDMAGGQGAQLYKQLQAAPKRPAATVLQISTRLLTGSSGAAPGSRLDHAALLDKTAPLVQGRRSELALQRTTERFRAVFEHNPASCFLLDQEGRFLLVNRAFETLLGYPASELQGAHFAAFCFDKGCKKFSESLKETWGRRESQKVKTAVLRNDQQKLQLLLTMSAVVVEDHVSEVCCTATVSSEPERVQDESQENEQRLRALSDNLPDSAVFQYVREADGRRRFSYCSAGVERLIGVTSEDALRDPDNVFRLVSRNQVAELRELQEQSAVTLKDLDLELPMELQEGRLRWMHLHARPRRLSNGSVIWDGVFTDITETRAAELERESMMEFLHLINTSVCRRELVTNATTFFGRQSGCEAVGMRLKQGEDFPYFEARGFPPQFVQAENFLCCREVEGDVQRDHAGNPLLACMCGDVLCGRTDPAKSFFTREGSFWTNSTSSLLSTTTEHDRLSRTRNRCHGEGYESVALIPLRAAGQTLGLLQLNDPRPNRFRASQITFLERLAGHLAVALAKARAEEDLADSRERLRLAASAARLFAFEWNPKTDIVRREGDSAGILGVPFGQETAASFFSRVHPQDRADFVELVQSLTPEHDSYTTTYRVSRGDGGEAVLEESGRAFFDEDGRFVRLIGMTSDITLRRRAEEAVRRRAEELERLLEVVPAAVWVANDPQCLSIYGNRRANEFYEARVGDNVSASAVPEARRFFSPEGRELDASELPMQMAAATNQAVQNTELEVRLPSGRKLNIMGSAVPLQDELGNVRGCIAAFMDITERKQFQTELERLVAERTAKLHDLVGELEHLSYSITHDMRAPLRAMRGFAEVVGELCSDRPEPELQRLLGRIIGASERMDSLITDALSYSKAVRQELPLAPVDLHRLLQGMLDTYPEFLNHRDCITLDPGIPRVMGNEAAMTQCFSNLIGNGLKFVAKGQKPEVRIRSELHSQAGSHPRVRIWVEDKGIGIAPAMLPRLFQMFSRASGEYEGTGIGLALCRKVVQRMEGKLGVESQPGKGSRFFVELNAAHS